MNSLNKIDRLFIAKALQKKVTKAVKEMQSECDSVLKQLYESTGTTQMRSVAFGKEAGCYSLPLSEEVPAHTEVSFALDNDESYLNWLSDNQDTVVQFAFKNYKQFSEWCAENAGEVPEGILATITEVPAIAAGIPQSPRLTVKEDVVFDKLSDMGLIESINQLLLEPAEGKE